MRPKSEPFSESARILDSPHGTVAPAATAAAFGSVMCVDARDIKWTSIWVLAESNRMG